MNQILSVEMPDNKKNKKKSNKKNGQKATIKSVLIFFCIALLLLGIIIVAIGAYYYLNKETEEDGNITTNSTTTEDNTSSTLNIEVIPDTDTLSITVKSDYEIDNVIYKWNDEEETQINGNGENEVSFETNIPDGTNTLTITAKDINGEETTKESEYTKSTEEYEPTITLEQEENTINIVIESESTIDYVSYTFDDEEKTEEDIGSTTTEIPIEITSGDHTLKVSVTNVDGETYEVTNSVYLPTIKVIREDENFVISASTTTNETINITTIEITLNGEEQDTITVNDTEYEATIPLEEGENKLVVVVNTENGSYTRKIKYENE